MKIEFSKKKSNFMKIRPVGAKLFHADGTDITKLQVVFLNFAKVPKNGFFGRFLVSHTFKIYTALENMRKL